MNEEIKMKSPLEHRRQADPEFDKLMSVREKIRGALESIADAGTDVESGAGLGGFDFWVILGGEEYSFRIKCNGPLEDADDEL